MNWKKVIAYVGITLIVLSAITYWMAGRLNKQIYGGLTEVVDYTIFEPETGTFAISDIHLLSEDADSFLMSRTVTIADGVIVSIDLEQPSDAGMKVIDGGGKYLIPGLIDAHVHLFNSPNDLLLYIANGVTEIRELIGMQDHLDWRSEIEGGRIGPDMHVATPRLGSFGKMEGWMMEQTQGFMNIEDAADAQRTLKSLHRQGYDAVKVYSHLNKESYLAITETAAALGMPVYGHIPWAISLDDVWSHGQSDIAHFEEIMNALRREYGNYNGEEDKFLAFVKERCEVVAQQLIANDISVTSTLWLVESFVPQKYDLDKVLTEVELAYENPGISEWSSYIPGGLGWLPGVNRYKSDPTLNDDEREGERRFWSTYATACKVVAQELIRHGVTIMAGTDANLPPTVPGFSLHDELQSLNTAGMTTTEVLKSATVTTAQRLQSNSGMIKPGYKANLVLLDKNPLEDIAHTKAINTVIKDGKVYDRALLDEMLAAVKQANDASRKVDVSEY